MEGNRLEYKDEAAWAAAARLFGYELGVKTGWYQGALYISGNTVVVAGSWWGTDGWLYRPGFLNGHY